MKRLNFHETNGVKGVVWPAELEVADLNLPAVRVFTDFMLHRPSVANVSAKAADTEAAMRREHVQVKLVVDDYDTFLGIVTLDDLNGEEILKKVAEGYRRQELLVSDFMKAKNALRSLDYAELERASLGDVLLALKSEGQQHCLVIDRVQQCVRGVICASDVARRVKLPLALQRDASFIDIFRAVHPLLSH